MEIILHMISISHHGLWCRCILQRREYRTLARKSLRTSDIPDQLKPTTRKRKKIKKSSASVPRGIRKIFSCFQVSHDFICYSSYCLPYNSYVVSLENFVWDQLAIHKWSAWYCAAVVGRNILSWSLKAVKWLKLCKTLTVRGFVTSVPQPTPSLS